LADIRSVPRSRRNPQFNRETLPEFLAAAGISYAHLKALGGLRKPRRDSVNTAWRTDGFRGYADYMDTPEFEAGLQTLLELAGQRQTSVMCAEALWWRCHRRLLSDVLLVRGITVEHILNASKREPHQLTPYARVERTRICYPGIMGAL
jgi:uncharacterized protein (DUF488 family)